jgi:hypothetical protein
MSVVAPQLRDSLGKARAQRSFVAGENQGTCPMSGGWRTITSINRATNEDHETVVLPEELHPGIGCRGSWAVFSPCRRWWYRLVRVWDSDKPRLAWVILNGSDADEHRTDATVRRCIGFARAWGYGGVDITNLYALVSKNPGALAHDFDRVGPDNDRHLAAVCSQKRPHSAGVGTQRRQRPRPRGGPDAESAGQAPWRFVGGPGLDPRCSAIASTAGAQRCYP